MVEEDHSIITEEEISRRSKKLNVYFEKVIKEKGINFLINGLKETKEKNKFLFIDKAFDDFKKEIELFPKVTQTNEFQLSVLDTLKENIKRRPIIFKIEDNFLKEENIFKIDKVLIPFYNFFIASNIQIEFENELYNSEGFYVLEVDKESLLVIFFLSRLIKDGWSLELIKVKKNSINKSFDEKKIGFEYGKNVESNSSSINNEVRKKFIERFRYLLNKILFLIDKKEYEKYFVYEDNKLVEKEIVFSHMVSSHKRHFWSDSGKFLIPTLPKEDIIKKGYLIDELVYRDGELRRDVPYTIIGSFKTGEDELSKKNREIELFERRRWRKEECLGKLLRQLFPNEFIKRHDRKVVRPLELDFYIRELNLAFEYDGEQHFDRELCENVFGSDFDELKKRDRKKEVLCMNKGIRLIRIKYNESLTKKNIKEKINGIRKKY